MKNPSLLIPVTLILVVPSKILVAGNCPPRASTTIEDRLFEYAEDLLKDEDPSKYPQMTSSGKFSDLTYQSENDFKVHGTRVGAIVLKHIKDRTTLLPNEIASFNYVADSSQTPALNSTNWWDHLIGVPEKLWAPLFLARGSIGSAVKTKYIERYFNRTKFGPIWNMTEHSGRMSGGNFAPRMFLAFVVSLVEDKLCYFIPGMKTELEREVVQRKPYDGNGLRQDGCLHQHNLIYIKLPPNNKVQKSIYSEIYFNYGKEFLRNAARVMSILDGTTYDLGDDIEKGIFASFLECQQWLYKHHTVDPVSTGRFIDSGERVTKFNGKNGVEEPLKYFLKINRYRTEIEAAKKRYEDMNPDPMYALMGNQHFFVSDMMVHQRHKYMATLRLLSKRTVRPESKPELNENRKGYYEGDGFLSVMVTGEEFGEFENEVFQVYNWARIPGVSCHYTNNIPEKDTTHQTEWRHAFNDADFVGGVSNDKEGFATMVYNRPTVRLTGKKSWFFTNSVIFCIGSDIALPSSALTNSSVITTLNQVAFAGTHAEWRENTSPSTLRPSVTRKMEQEFSMSYKPRFHHDSIGYVPIKHNGKVHRELDNRTHGGPNAKDILTYSLWLDHGTMPSNAQYVYAILPGQSELETENFANSPTIKALKTTSDIHAAILLKPTKVIGAAFFVKGCLDGNLFGRDFAQICVNSPVLILIKEMAQISLNCSDVPQQLTKPSSLTIKLQISVADPTQSKTQVELKIGNWFKHTFSFPPEPNRGKSVSLCFEI